MRRFLVYVPGLVLTAACTSATENSVDALYDRMTQNQDGSYTCLATNGESNLERTQALAEVVETNAAGHLEATFSGDHEFIYISPGPFEMGSDDWGPDESPAHTVTLSGYWIGKDFITNAQFAAFVEETDFVTDAEKPEAEGCYIFAKHPDRAGGDWTPTPGRNWRNAFVDHPTDSFYREFSNLADHPVGCVSWYDAMAYGEWLSGKLQQNISLPTEAQWEKAARGTDGRVWPWGNTPPTAEHSNFADAAFAAAYEQPNQGEPDISINDGWSATSPIGAFPEGASPYGVLDMAGNTTAWVFDVSRTYSADPVRDPIGLAPEHDRTDREMRGGFWISSRGTLTPSLEEIRVKHTTRSDLRAADDPRSSDDHLGFRVAIDYCPR